MLKADKLIFATLFFSVFINITGVGIVVPLLPVYAHNLGAKGIYIGMIFGVFAFSRTLFLPYFGRQSDFRGRKPYIVAGLLAYALISLAFMYADSIELLIATRLVQGIGSAMVWPAAQAYVGDITPEKREGFTMGMFSMATFIGLSIGPLAGGMINEYFSLQTAFACMGVMAFIGFLFSLIFLPPVKSERVLSQRHHTSDWKTILKDPSVKGLFFYRLSYTACIGIIWGFIPVFANIKFGLSSSKIGILVTLGVLISGIMQTPMGYIADRVNRKNMVIIGGLITSCAILSFQWATGYNYLLWTNLVFGIGGGVLMSPLMALAVEKGSSLHAMGSIMSVMTMGHSIGMMAGSMIAGLLMDSFSLQDAFIFGSIMMMSGIIIFNFTYRLTIDQKGAPMNV